MQTFLAEYGLFLLKALTLLVVLVVAGGLLAGIAARARRSGAGGGKGKGGGRAHRDRPLQRAARAARRVAVGGAPEAGGAARGRQGAPRPRQGGGEGRGEGGQARCEAREEKRLGKDGRPTVEDKTPRRVFVLDFDGDIRASEVAKLRREITAVLTGATPEDEIVVRVDSGGGVVTGYGLAASQLDRIRKRRIPLTVCVDKVAASGGYMMACVADRLLAAPFAVLGSIGVVAQIPNFHRLLKELNVDVEILTAGKYKRTLTLFGENTDEGRRKLVQDIERIHAQFKEYVGEHRPALDVERVSTGEVWSGQDALDLNLIDEITTSDEYLNAAAAEREVLLVGWKAPKKGLMARFAASVEESADRLALRWFERLVRSRFP